MGEAVLLKIARSVWPCSVLLIVVYAAVSLTLVH